MTQEQMLEQIVKQVLASMNNTEQAAAPETPAAQVTKDDYPIADKKPELIKTQTGFSRTYCFWWQPSSCSGINRCTR